MKDFNGGGRRSPPKLHSGGDSKVAASGDGGKASSVLADFRNGSEEASAGSRKPSSADFGEDMEVHASEGEDLLNVECGLHCTAHVVKEVGGPTIDALPHVDTFMESGDPGFGKANDQTMHATNDVVMSDHYTVSSLPGGIFKAGTSQATSSGQSSRTPPVWGNAAPTKSNLGGSGENVGGSKVQGNQLPNAWVRPTVFTLPSKGDLGNFETGDDIVQLDEDEVQATVKEFDTALVGRLFGRNIPYYFLNAQLSKLWGRHGPFRIVTISGDCFICFFNTVEARDAVLMGGPWIVAGQVLGLDFWSPAFTPKSAAGFITPVWVRLPGLPMYCWGEKNLARIASPLGEPLWMDAATKRLERGHFARICVRMDLAKPLKPGVWVNGSHGSFYQAAEYEGLSSFCFHCGHVGHKEQFCGMKGKGVLAPPSTITNPPVLVADKSTTLSDKAQCTLQTQVLNGTDAEQIHTPVVHAEDNTSGPRGLGPWMLVTRKKRPPRSVQSGAATSKVKRKPPMHKESTGGTRGAASWAPNIAEMNRRCAREQGEVDHNHNLDVSHSLVAEEIQQQHGSPSGPKGSVRKKRKQFYRSVGGDASPQVN